MKRILCIAIAIFSLSIYSQSKGDDFRNEGTLEKAVEAYKASLKENPGDYNNTYNLACAYALMYKNYRRAAVGEISESENEITETTIC